MIGMEKNYTAEQILNALLDMQPYRSKDSRKSMSLETFEVARYCMEICMILNEEELKSKRKRFAQLSP